MCSTGCDRYDKKQLHSAKVDNFCHRNTFHMQVYRITSIKLSSSPLLYATCRYQTKDNFTMYKKDFVTLYVDVLKTVVNAEHSSGIYVSSSPSNGVESEKEGWVAQNPYDTKYGDGKFSTTIWTVSMFCHCYTYTLLVVDVLVQAVFRLIYQAI